MVDFGFLLFALKCENRVDSGKVHIVNPKLGAASSTVLIYGCKLTNTECDKTICQRRNEIPK